ncbi:DNA glycosylase [Chytriomyces sp. MP71]|nr:DNA glycosylase [Chytriomyces sp. MP71]
MGSGSVQDYRASHRAPVDDVGCSTLADADAEPKVFRYQNLVALQLSSQTKDPINAAAMARLKEQLPTGLTPQSVLDVSEKRLQELLYGVSFHLKKAVYMQSTARILIDSHDSDVPSTVEGLLALPGIGPKMAYLALQSCWNIQEAGIGVDTHVHRISNKLGWVRTRKEDPEATRKELQDWLPSKYWAEVNPLLVGFGQVCCSAVKPKCSECPVEQYCSKLDFKKKLK